MTSKKLFIMFSILFSMVGTKALAFIIKNADGVSISYNYINDGNELEVTSNNYTGVVVIPEEVTYNGRTLKVTRIGNDAFLTCGSLTSVTIPNNVTSIGNRAFFACGALTSITFPNSMTEIGSQAFYGCSSLNSITIPNSVTSIGNYAFENCSGLNSVTIPNSMTEIGSNVFSGCSSLTSITIPNSVTNIGSNAFSYCGSLTSVTIPNSVTSIGGGAFSGCSGLKNVTIPNSVTYIGNHAFSGCSSLTSITIPNSVTEIGDEVFVGCASLTSFSVNEDNTAYKSVNGVLMSKDGTILIAYPAGKIETTYLIPNNVTTIERYAFAICNELTSVTIPNSVTKIGNKAFAGCSSLTSIIIPNSISILYAGIFEGCSSLTSVTIPNSITYIGSSVFRKCIGLKSITIPNSVTQIGSGAFEECFNLTAITIPSSVTNLEGYVFDGCRLEVVMARNSKTKFKDAFSDRTYQHAMLYIPEGTWGEAIYDGDWYRFNNIRETAMQTDAISSSRSYTLMDTKTFGYAIYDGSNDEVKIVKAFYSIDEQNPNNCWTIKKLGGKSYLYNEGAKKYVTISSDGKFRLTDNETPISLKETEDGIMLGEDTSHLWGLVKIPSETTGITPQKSAFGQSNNSYYSLDGYNTKSLHKGLNIIKKSDGTSKKVVIK